MSKQRQIGVTFTKRNSDLIVWATEEAERQKRPLAWIGQDAFECYRLSRQIWGANWQDEMQAAKKATETIKQLQILIAWGREDITTQDAKIALKVADTEILNQMLVEAIEAGKRLVR